MIPSEKQIHSQLKNLKKKEKKGFPEVTMKYK